MSESLRPPAHVTTLAPVPRDRLPPDRPPRPAATLVLLRDGAAGLEVLLVRRAERGDLNSGAWVFPGGLVDEGDRAAHAVIDGADDAGLSAAMGLPGGGLDYLVAALRETFEEAGLLLADDAQGHPAAPAALADAQRQRLQAWRGLLHRGEGRLADCCAEFGWRLAGGRAIYLSHWLTPPGRAKRFDTRFFLAEAPSGQSAGADSTETVDLRWMRPADALAPQTALKLMTPTQKTLEVLRGFERVSQALDWARANPPREVIAPHVGVGRDGSRPVTPDEPAWAELRHIDPLGYGDASYDLVPGVPVRLSERIVRVTAPNGSVMTGPGTNSYFIGSGDDWALLDPGPADPVHVQALLAAAPGRVTRVLVTHTHPDHSPAAALLRAHWPQARLAGMRARHPEWQDAGFAPDDLLAGGERLTFGAGTTLRALHTPGHASNHLCWLLEEERILFTGDHVMQGSTVVINPPDGHMQSYLDSLATLRDDLGPSLTFLAPGHGFLMPLASKVFDTLIRHRLQREAKVLRCLDELQAASPGVAIETDALLARVYDDVPPGRLPVARRSLRAHLEKLVEEGRVRAVGPGWAAAS